MNSVIIPTHNRSKSLLRTLDSLICQTTPPEKYEILIIDDESVDDTEAQIAKYQIQNTKYKIRYFKIKHSGSAAAKNYGIKQSKGEIIFFTDDDCIIPENWMEVLLNGYRIYPNIVGAGGWYMPPEDEKRFFQKTGHKINLLFNSLYADEKKFIETFPTCVALIPNVSYKRDILEKIGGFDEKISALGSPELKYRVMFKEKQRILYVPTSVIHNCPLSAWGYIKKLFRQGRCKQYANLKYFNGKPPLNFDVSFLYMPQKLFKALSQIINKKEVKISDLPAIFTFIALEVFFNACGGFCEKYLG